MEEIKHDSGEFKLKIVNDMPLLNEVSCSGDPERDYTRMANTLRELGITVVSEQSDKTSDDEINVMITTRHLFSLLSHNDYLKEFLNRKHSDATTKTFIDYVGMNVNFFSDEQLEMLSDWMFKIPDENIDAYNAYNAFIVLAYLKTKTLQLKMQDSKVQGFVEKNLGIYRDSIDILLGGENSSGNNNEDEVNEKPLSSHMLLALARVKPEQVSDEHVAQVQKELESMLERKVELETEMQQCAMNMGDDPIDEKKLAMEEICKEYNRVVAGFRCMLPLLNTCQKALEQIAKNTLAGQLLIDSVLYGNFQLVEKLIDAGVDPYTGYMAGMNPQNPKGISMIAVAGMMGCLETVRVLKNTGHYDQETIKQVVTFASTQGHLDIACELSGADFDVKATDDFGNTSLHKAASGGNLTGVVLALSLGAEVNVENQQQRTPFHLACEQGHIQIAELLLAKGAKLDGEDKYRRTPLDLSLSTLLGKEQFIEMACWLIEKGADPYHKDKQDKSSLDRVSGEAKEKLEEAIAKKDRALTDSPVINWNANFAYNNNSTVNPPVQEDKSDLGINF